MNYSSCLHSGSCFFLVEVFKPTGAAWGPKSRKAIFGALMLASYGSLNCYYCSQICAMSVMKRLWPTSSAREQRRVDIKTHWLYTLTAKSCPWFNTQRTCSVSTQQVIGESGSGTTVSLWFYPVLHFPAHMKCKLRTVPLDFKWHELDYILLVLREYTQSSTVQELDEKRRDQYFPKLLSNNTWTHTKQQKVTTSNNHLGVMLTYLFVEILTWLLPHCPFRKRDSKKSSLTEAICRASLKHKYLGSLSGSQDNSLTTLI